MDLGGGEEGTEGGETEGGRQREGEMGRGEMENECDTSGCDTSVVCEVSQHCSTLSPGRWSSDCSPVGCAGPSCWPSGPARPVA